MAGCNLALRAGSGRRYDTMWPPHLKAPASRLVLAPVD